eukprot:SAG31_NODE_206_length_20335_cov_17.910160_13_plen_63_part_00
MIHFCVRLSNVTFPTVFCNNTEATTGVGIQRRSQGSLSLEWSCDHATGSEVLAHLRMKMAKI